MQDLALDWRWVEFVALWMSSLAVLLFLSTILIRYRRNLWTSSLAVLLFLSTILMRYRRNHHDGGRW